MIFKFKVRQDGCWEWLGRIDKTGYGRGGDVENRLAHRSMWEAMLDPIPEGMTLDHLCRNRSCVNPAHLEVVSLSENTKRAWAARRQENTCDQGHLVVGDNVTKSGKCRTCYRHHQREYMRRWYAAKKIAAQGAAS
jgi:hypothetical protein